MRLKTSGSDGGSRSAGGGGGGESRCVGGAPVAPGMRRRMRGPASGERGSAAPPPVGCRPTPGSPRLARLGGWHFAGLGTSGPRAEEGRVPRTLGGAVHRRVTGGSESRRAWEAGRARPSQEDSAAAPARRASGTST